MNLCTIAGIKSYLKMDTDQNDAELNRLVSSCSEFFQNYCDRDFSSGSQTDYFNGGRKTFFLSRLPVDLTKDFQVWVDSSRLYTSDDLVDADDYGVDPYSGILKLDFEAGEGFRAVKVSYTGGYTVVPYDLSQACIELIAKKFREGTKGELGVIQRTMPGGDIAFTPQDLLPQIESVLNLYRREAR